MGQLSINELTTYRWSFEEDVRNYAAAGITSIGVWRQKLSDFGEEKPLAIAVIDEDLCIGCTLCIQACPVDAILGASKQMHTVIVSECTGCDLCVEPCPVDCIDMVVPEPQPGNWKWPSPEQRVSQ